MTDFSFDDFIDQLAHFKQDAPVSYTKIRDAFDPYHILKAGEPYPETSVDYFVRAWDVDVRTFGYPGSDERAYDAEDWLLALVGAAHVGYFLRKFSEPTGFFMTRLADDLQPIFVQGYEYRRWVGSAVGLRAMAIRLCSWRQRPGLDTARIHQHACYIASEMCLITDMRYNPAIREAVTEYLGGQRLDAWEATVENLDMEGGAQ